MTDRDFIISIQGSLASLQAQITAQLAGTTVPPYVPTVDVPPNPGTPPPGGTGNPGAIIPNWDPEVQGLLLTPPLFLASKQVVAIPLVGSSSGKAGVTFTQGQTANSAGRPKTYFQVSRTPGVIDDTQPYYKGTFVNNNAIEIYQRIPGSAPHLTPEMIVANGWAWAPPSEGQWYLNLMWEHDAGQISFSLKFVDGVSYN